MPRSPEERRLFTEATDLAIRLSESPQDAALIARVRDWVGQGAAQRAAWDRVMVIHGVAGQALRPSPGPSRRQMLSLAGLGLAGALGAGLAGPGLLRRWRADHLTGIARLDEITLPDGSRAILGPDSALALAFTESHRRIELLQGMAYFELREAPARPFALHSGGVRAEGSGGGFEISQEAGQTRLSVSEGWIEARGAGGAEALAAGDWLTFGPDRRLLARGRRDSAEVASWRGGMLIAEAETVGALIERIARWQPGPVVLADGALGARVVSGVFDLRDPLAALEMVVEPFGGRVRSLGGALTVISSI